MRYAGIDYGVRRVGVAVSDTEGKFAFPHVMLPNDDALIRALQKLAAEKRIAAFIVGDARSLSGAENPITAEAERFAEELKTAGVPVHIEREAWSSVEARRFTGEARANDASAAAIILQRYLDRHGV